MLQLNQYEKMLKKDQIVHKNTQSLQSLSLNVRKETNQEKVLKEEKPVIQGEKGGVITKRHKQTPLPKILTMKTQSIPKYGMGKRQQRDERMIIQNKKSDTLYCLKLKSITIFISVTLKQIGLKYCMLYYGVIQELYILYHTIIQKYFALQ